MAGVTETGFVTKRFPDVIEELREQAVPLFQDLVPPGDIVDTSDSTLLGRLIGLTATAITEVWEAMQEVYAAFDPNSATGIPHVNLVALGGMTPQAAVATTVSSIVWGDTLTDITPGVVVKSTIGSLQYAAPTGVSLTTSEMSGAGIQVTDVIEGNDYDISLISYAGITNLSDTSLAGDTEEDILARLQTQLASDPNYTSELVGTTLYIKFVDHYGSFDASLTGDLAIVKVAKRLDFAAEEIGPNELQLNTLTTIVTPVLGWDSVNNPIPAVVGSYAETDEQLRERFRESKYLRASNTNDALYSALQELSGVQEIKLYINDTDLVDSIGLDPHSFLALVLGGSDTEIAKTIWKHTPLGIASQGAQEVSVTTKQGNTQVVKFDRPVYVPLYVEIDLSTYTGFPSGGESLIAQKLADYINNNQTIGDRVVYSRLFDPVNEIPGHEIVTLKIGTSPGVLSETTLVMAYNEIPTLSTSNITFI